MDQWKTISKKVILQGNRFLTVENHTVELPDGRIIPDWQWIITPDFVNVVAITENERFLCFRQTKYAVRGTSLAPVGGYMEPGEDPLQAAKRELLEETGYEAAAWTPLGSFSVDANRGAGVGHFFLARGARRIAEPKSDDLEEQELLLLSRKELEDAVAKSDFKVLPWVAGILLALQSLSTGNNRSFEKSTRPI
ncbi:MAG: NUDIX hydrolase [Ignavibacteriales bacterium]|nr:NUDIX hydrolase [Ignavibacteriales bacterium]